MKVTMKFTQFALVAALLALTGPLAAQTPAQDSATVRVKGDSLRRLCPSGASTARCHRLAWEQLIALGRLHGLVAVPVPPPPPPPPVPPPPPPVPPPAPPPPPPPPAPVPPPPPPPDQTLPNQPAGFLLIQDYRFDVHPQALVGPGTWGSTYRDRPDAEYRLTATGFSGAAPHGGTVGDMWMYNAFSGEGVEPDALGIELTAAHKLYAKLYIAFWIQFSANWQGHGSGFDKIFHLWTPPGSDPRNRVFFSAVNFSGSNTGNDATTIWPSSFCVNLQTPWGARNLYDQSRHPDFPKPPGMMGLRRGVWHRIEVLLEQNTGDNFDGKVRAWVDGVLTQDYSDVRFTLAGEAKGWHYLEWAPTWGGYSPINVNRSGGMHMFMDRIYMSGRN